MELQRIPVLVATIAILLGAVFLGAASSIIGQTQVEAQGGSGKTWSLSWTATIDTNFASVVAIGFFDGSSPSEHVSVLTSRPEVVTMTVRDGIILDKSRLRMTSFPVADQFFAQSRDGTIIAWIDLQKGGPVLVVFVLTNVGCCGLFPFYISLLFGTGIAGALVQYSQTLTAAGLGVMSLTIILMIRGIRKTQASNQILKESD